MEPLPKLDNPGDRGLDGGNSTMCGETWPLAGPPFLAAVVFGGHDSEQVSNGDEWKCEFKYTVVY